MHRFKECYMHVKCLLHKWYINAPWPPILIKKMHVETHVTCMKNVPNPLMLHETCMYKLISTCMLQLVRKHNVKLM